MPDSLPDPHARHHRQMILPGFGVAAQARLAGAHALVVGCGALGCAAIDLLARAGVGTLTLLDQQAQLDITLGLLLKSFAPKIEEKVAMNMQKVFANNA